MQSRVLITGGASGLGRALAQRYLADGWRVLIGDLNEQRGAELADELTGPGELVFRPLDVRDENSLVAARDWLQEHWGGLDVLINNAGVAAAGRVENLSDEDWRWIVDINLLGTVNGCRVFTSMFKEQGSGHFVNIASMAGLLNPPVMGSYNVTKASVVALSETLRYELAPWNIHTTVVCPSFFQTNLAESLRSSEPGMADVVARLLASSAISADDIATMIRTAVRRRRFMLVPHKAARRARLMQRLLPPVFRRQMYQMASRYRRKLESNT